MTLGRSPVSIFCSRGTPTNPESIAEGQGQNLALTVLYVPNSIESGTQGAVGLMARRARAAHTLRCVAQSVGLRCAVRSGVVYTP